MNRRHFIKSTAIIGAVSFLPIPVFSFDEDKSVVWEVEGNASAAVKKIFEELGGVSALLPKGVANSTVILKPNLCLPDNDSKATTTSSALVGEICRYLSEQGVTKIIVTDHTLQGANLFESQPIVTEAQKHPGVKVLLANDQRYFIPTEVKGKVLTSVETLKLLPKADLMINLPTAKHHTATQVSLGIKNLMGLIWDRSAFHTGLDLNQAIGDLALAIKPDITIIDATRVLLKGGPTGPGPVVEDNRFYVSRDIVAVDSVVTSRYSFGGKSLSAQNVAHIKAAYENGLGEIDINKIELKKITAE
jgi:uncharacterized protein (DUF362 family)